MFKKAQIMTSESNLLEFLRNTVARELSKFSNAELEFYGFSILLQAVEIAGSIFDGKSANDYKQCENRFKKGFKNIFRCPPYLGHSNKFFTDVRGPVVHQLRPGCTFTFTCLRMGAKREDHFKSDAKSQLILVYEVLVDDFAFGLDQMIKDLSAGKYKGIVDESNLNKRYFVTYDFPDRTPISSICGGLSAQP